VVAKNPWSAFIIAVLIINPAGAFASEIGDIASRLPRISPTSPNKALATFQVRPGFRIELVAAEPLVADPVAMDFDARGRLFVVEMCDYSEQDRERLGRVRVLEDTDRDGRFERSRIFAGGLSWPTAVLCYRDGVFVGAAPDILFLRDTDGDGRCDTRETVITGLGRTNVQGLINSFRWGLDNRVHVAASSCGGELRVVASGAKPATLSIRGRDFSFDPRTFDLRAETGGAQHGMCFDDWGRKFVCSNSNHIQLVMVEDRYLARNRFLAAPSPLASIAADGPAAEVFRISPVEPWRIVRTELRVAGKVPGPIEGGGRAAGYFTSATGVTIYRGDAWPAEFRGLAIVGDVGSNLIHRKRLSPDGLALVAKRIDEKSEFVASRDIWFRPVQFANAPDGALYVADMYREVIEHPASLPPEIKRHLDLTSGRDRGRIYRIVPEGFTQPKRPMPAELSTADLVALLGHASAWHRETAARLLFERREFSCVPPLRRMMRSDSPLGRLHALYVLDGLNALRPADLVPALSDAHPNVRVHAVRLAERKLGESRELRLTVANLADDPEINVRYQVAITLGEIKDSEATAALARIARRDANDAWMRVAIGSSSLGRAGAILAQLFADKPAISDAKYVPLAEMLARQAGLEGEAAQVTAVSDVVRRAAAQPRLAGAMLRALAIGLSRSQNPQAARLRASDSPLGKQLAALVEQAEATARDSAQPPGERAVAIEMLSLDGRDRTTLVADLLTPDQPAPVLIAALRALSRSRGGDVAKVILNRWAAFSPTIRTEAMEALFARPERLAAVLAAVERGDLRAADLEPSRVKQLVEHRDSAIRARAQKLLGQAAAGRRDDVVKAHAGVLAMSGDPSRGRDEFRKTCAACHRLEGVGHNTGPDLAAIKNRGPEAILLALLDPNREVNPQYLNYALTTADGRSATGLVAAETATSVTLRRGEGLEETFLRGDIEQLRATGMSLMPEGIERQLSRQQLADLIAYLMTVR
jgi:putative membrane-bound dehydrogenase-like protein